MRSTNDDLSPGMCNSDFTARVALIGKLAHEEFAEFSEEYTVCDKLASFANDLVARHVGDVLLLG